MAVMFRFTKDFDYAVNRNTDVAYKKGTEDRIPDAHAKAAEEAGAGERITEEAKAEDRPERARRG